MRSLLGGGGADPLVPGDYDTTRPPVYLAAMKGQVVILKLMLLYGASPDTVRTGTGCTLLCAAAAGGHIDCVTLLLGHEADPNQVTNTDGMAPVYMAAGGGHAGVIRVLLEHNADPNHMDTETGTTPVLVSVTCGHVDAVKVLLEYGADPNLRNNPISNQATAKDETPLHTLIHAAVRGGGYGSRGSSSLQMAQLLVVFGADLRRVDSHSDTPADIAEKNGQELLAEWMNAVDGWSPLRVAAALRMHNVILFHLQRGYTIVSNLDDQWKEAIAAAESKPADLPWGGALQICHTTSKLVRDASVGWKYTTHTLYHTSLRGVVHAVLRVASRLVHDFHAQQEQVGGVNASNIDGDGANEATTVLTVVDGELDGANVDAPLPLLPPEIWFFIMIFFQRSWWAAV